MRRTLIAVLVAFIASDAAVAATRPAAAGPRIENAPDSKTSIAPESETLNSKTRSPACIEFATPDQGLTYCVSNGLWEHFDCGTADADFSARRVEVSSDVVEALYIRILVNDVEIAQWYADAGADQHVENATVDIEAGDKIYYSFGNVSHGCVEDPVQVKFYDAPISTTGSLQVAISPQGAIDAGAKWRVDEGEWQNSGTTVGGLTEGNHTVSYSSVTGWNKPADASVAVTAGETAAASGTYTQQTGAIQVTISPQEAIDTGAKWQVDGGEWRNSGARAGGLAAGNHTVSYSSVTGWNKPADASVAVTAGETAAASGTYTQQTGALNVRISPQEAIDAGAKWRVDSGAWQDSSATVGDLSEGDHTVSFKVISGWVSYLDRSVTVSAGATSKTTGPYWYIDSKREALTALYNSTGGDNWTDNSGWKDDSFSDGFAEPGFEFRWYGISLDHNELTYVEEIDLSENNLNGTIPPELGNLTTLKHLDLSSNQLSGPIPPELGNLTTLKHLDLHYNQLWGCIPKSLGNCDKLTFLALVGNELSGEIPMELMNLSSSSIYLSLNHLYTSNSDLKDFLDQRPGNYDGQTFDTNNPRVEPSENCGVYTPCFSSFQDAFAFFPSPSVVFAAEGEYRENIVIEDGDTLVLTWDKEFSCGPPSGPVILSGPLP